MKNLKELVETLGIKISCVSAPFNPHMQNSENMFHWACVLSRESSPTRGLNVMFSKGGGLLEINPKFSTRGDIREIKDNIRDYYYDFSRRVIRKSSGNMTLWQGEMVNEILQAETPKAEEVIDCLLSDSIGLRYSNFETWASDLGYSTDSIKALETYNLIRKQSQELINFLDEANYFAAMEMERD